MSSPSTTPRQQGRHPDPGRPPSPCATRAADIIAAVDQVTASSRRVQEEIVEAAAVAEQASASSQEVSASTEETSASTQQIAGSASDLARTSDELQRLVAQFTLRSEG